MLPLYRFIEIWIFPPGVFLLIGIFAIYVVRRRRRVGQVLLAFSIGSLWLFSTPLFSFFLLNGLQNNYPPLVAVPPQVDSIVVLGGGREVMKNEFGRTHDLTLHGVARVRYAAYLAKQTGLPVITSGGQPFLGGRAEGEIMKEVLQTEFGVETVFVEGRSTTTFENAAMSKYVLAEHGLSKPLVVTEYWHMPRALFSFNRHGMEAFAAPTGMDTPSFTETGVWAVLPQADSMARSRQALHEWLGRVWYKMKF